MNAKVDQITEEGECYLTIWNIKLIYTRMHVNVSCESL